MQKWCVTVRVLCTCLPTFPLLSCLLLFLAIKNVFLLSYTISSCHICMLTSTSYVLLLCAKCYQHASVQASLFKFGVFYQQQPQAMSQRGVLQRSRFRLTSQTFFSFSLQLQTMLTFEAIYQTSHSFHWNHKKVITYNLSTYRASSEYRPTLFCVKLVSIY